MLADLFAVGNMNLTEAEIAALEACTSEDQWNAQCDAVKAARGGAYPPDWWPVMKLSGRMDRILAGFGGDSEIRLIAIR